MRKTDPGNVIGWGIRSEKVGSVPTFLLSARTNSLSGKWAEWIVWQLIVTANK
jgi:hypothetical protein